jgi:hypothetical protein
LLNNQFIRSVISTILCFLFICTAQGQQDISVSNLRNRKISTEKNVFQIDSLTIVPGTFVITGIPVSYYQLDPVKSELIWLTKPLMDSVSVLYRVFPFKLNASAFRMRYEEVMNNFITKPIQFDDGSAFGKGMFDFGTINYNGSFGRGISFGNNQDAVVNGVLNLQINGIIGDSMQLTAALTDNNLPIQAEGNTQQLNEFDQVWIQLKKKSWQLNLGDIDIRRNDAYFLNFFKRLQGVSFQVERPVFASGKNTTLMSGAIAKGKFNRFIFQGLEGNQGPYRLQGPNGELFFIVLAGTERVFMDGELLQRGEDQDYVINYNTAEVTFTPKRMVTKDKRIQIEFEYSDRNFLNTQFFVSNEFQVHPQLTFRVNAFSNSDSKNSSINQVLNKEQKQFLSDAGDVLENALYPSIVKDTFTINRIYYRMTDSLVNGDLYDSVLVFTNQNTGTVYSAGFMDLGEGNGDYLPEVSGANGRAFKWIAPVNGKKMGRYAPVTKLIAPRTQQMMTVGMDYRIHKKLLLQTEFAWSKFDVNTFSKKDKSDDWGGAGRIRMEYENRFNGQRKNPLNYKLSAGYEQVQNRFRPLERLRPVEFTREWGLPIFLKQDDERITNAEIDLFRSSNNHFRYVFQTYRRGTAFYGTRHAIQYNLLQKGWNWDSKVSYSTTDSGIVNGFFLRPDITFKKTLFKLKDVEVGGRYYREHNEIRNKQPDSLSRMSFSWDTWTVYFRTKEQPNRFGFNFFTRRDLLPSGKQFIETDRSLNYSVYGEWMKNEHHQFKINATLRTLKVYNAMLSGQKSDRTLLGRGEYLINEWKGFVTGNVLYELGSGQEQKRDFSFLEVPAGQGEYTWNDYNNDGVPQLNEFEIAQFRDQARYIRVFTPTLDFIRANYNQLNYSFNFNPAAVLDSKSGKFGKFAARFSAQSSMQIFKKEISTKSFNLNPFGKPANDTSLITISSIITNTLFFNRTSSRWGGEFTHLRNTNRSILTYGLETRTLREITGRMRLNFNRKFSAALAGKAIKNELLTPGFANRNFLLQQWNTEPGISFQDGTKYRVQLSYKYEQKTNKIGLQEKALIHSVISEVKYNVLSSSTVNARFQFSNIQFEGSSTNSTVAFIMLDALLPGKNMIWNIDFTKRLSNNMELNFQYDGRKPGDGRVIHTGRASVRALF